jgi:hypothetical protein
MALSILVVQYVLGYICRSLLDEGSFAFDAVGSIALIPFIYFLFLSFKQSKELIKFFQYALLGGLLSILLLDLFNMQVILPKITGALFGAFLLWIGLFAYTKSSKQK